MTDEDKIDTKIVILDSALKLFAQFGYEGASIRQIAADANVNIAAINYHFKSKHNLYWAAMQGSHDFLRNKIEALSEESESIEDLVEKTFIFINGSKLMFRNTLKMMLNDQVPNPDDEFASCGASGDDGPPGAEFFALKLREELGDSVNEADIHWAIMAIFGAFFHWATLCSTAKFDLMMSKKDGISFEDIKIHLRRTVLTIKKSMAQPN